MNTILRIKNEHNDEGVDMNSDDVQEQLFTYLKKQGYDFLCRTEACKTGNQSIKDLLKSNPLETKTELQNFSIAFWDILKASDSFRRRLQGDDESLVTEVEEVISDT